VTEWKLASVARLLISRHKQLSEEVGAVIGVVLLLAEGAKVEVAALAELDLAVLATDLGCYQGFGMLHRSHLRFHLDIEWVFIDSVSLSIIWTMVEDKFFDFCISSTWRHGCRVSRCLEGISSYIINLQNFKCSLYLFQKVIRFISLRIRPTG
jgi:hypothetical protein